jgi:hypothetical protein
MGARVTVTDKKSLLRLIKKNFETNLKGTPECLSEVSIFLISTSNHLQAQFEEHVWGTDNNFGKMFDVIIGADLTYDFDDLPPLIKSLDNLTDSHSQARKIFFHPFKKRFQVFIAYGEERAATPTFLELSGKIFNIETIPSSQLEHSDIFFPTFTIQMALMKKKIK